MSFSAKSTAEDVTQGISLQGKTIVITGVNSGLGFETMQALLAKGAKVIALARTMEKAKETCAKLSGESVPVACELSDWASVKAAAVTIKSLDFPIDVLICNAGIMAPEKLQLAHGLEMQFATNYMGHFILTHHLLALIRRAEDGRIINLSSDAHKSFVAKGGIDFDNLDAHKGYKPWLFYGQAKMANLLHAKALAKRLEGSNASAFAVHPGIIRTGLGRDAGLSVRLLMFFTQFMHKNIPQGAATQCYVATQPNLKKFSGQYFSNCQLAKPHSWAANDALIDKLWLESEKIAKDYLIEH